MKLKADDLFQYAFKDLVKQNSGRLLFNKYLSKATGNYLDCVELEKSEILTISSVVNKRTS